MINEQLLENFFNLAGERHNYLQIKVITLNKLNEFMAYGLKLLPELLSWSLIFFRLENQGLY